MNTKLNGILFAKGFTTQKDGKRLYAKLVDAIATSIVEKKLRKGDKMPPTRLLAEDLGISRSTVIKAYDILSIKLFISSTQGSGFFVNDIEGKKLETLSKESLPPATYTQVSKRAQRFSTQANLMNRGVHGAIAFRPGLPPLDVFPVRQWQNLTNNYWKKITFPDMSYLSPLGLESLRFNIAQYVKMYRNINCDHEQIVMVTGSMHSLALVGDLMVDENDQVVLENPTYPNAIAIFKSLGAKIISTSIDAEGINIKDLKETKALKPKIIFATPSNQYPTGVQMSLNRRMELLDWAQKYNSLIIEDDYDHEFSNWNNPVPSIYSLDKNQRTIYHGTFNKLMHPAIRLGYMIVPKYLLNEIKGLIEQSFRFVSPETQKVMSDFIEKDYLSQHIRKVVQVSNERRQIFIACFKEYFKDHLRLDRINNGLHLVARLEDSVDDIALSKFLETKGIITFPYSKYFIEKYKHKGLVMGFSSVSPSMIKSNLQRMSTLVYRFMNR